MKWYDYIYKHELALGLLLLSSTLITWFLFARQYVWYAIASVGLTNVAVGFITDYSNRKVAGESLWPNRRSRFRRWLKFSLGALAFCFLLDFNFVLVTRLYYYDMLTPGLYLLLAPGAYFIYALILYQLYLGLRRWMSKRQRESRVRVSKQVYERIMRVELILGLVGIATCGAYVFRHVQQFHIPIWDISRDSGVPVVWWFPFLVLLSFFFIFEYWAAKEEKRTLTQDLVAGDLIPIVAIFFANILGLLFTELVNSPLGIWRYANWPMGELTLFNIPLLAYFVWPFQFFVLLSILRILFNKREEHIW